jgi:hypothetical protein
MATEPITAAITDASTGETRKVTITVEKNGIAIRPEGMGAFDSDDGEPIFLDLNKGHFSLFVWPDINNQNATKIDLTAALTSNRKADSEHANMIAYRRWHTGTIFYVANLPGDGGKGWGYTTKAADAIPLSPYWQRRFAADCRRVGTEAQFIRSTQQ